ncbi:GerAB/ArcD/ProY family transporter [Alteribacter natronophilus]|uniref:GerAB/ArcD/ProY family transporter n=1 Tax=Alteribacter natronophilus TaxID=2583810 RepID=UPI001FE6D7A3|nr:GerAB/ArcD/ProY family transporter [Alteribacter natronophilus]
MSVQNIKSMSHVSPFYVFFLVHSMQIGVGIFGFQRYIAMDAGYNAWITVILTGLLIHILIWMLYRILLDGGKPRDIIDVHRQYFGKYIGNLLSWAFLVYFLFMGITVLRTYIEVIQIWMFPTLITWPVALFFILIVTYGIFNGFRVVTGIAFLGVVLPFGLILTLISPLEFANYDRILPVEFILGEQTAAVKTMTLSFIGFESLAFYLPFINGAQKSQKWAHAGHGLTTLMYLAVTLVTFFYYSRLHLERVIYPSLSLWKVLELPVIERFEYVGLSMWLLVVMPNIIISVWVVSRGMKKLLRTKQRHTLFFTAGTLFLFTIAFETREAIDNLNNHVSTVGFYIIFCYVPALFILTAIIRRFRSDGKKNSGPSV